jgi:hypothetical protein
VTRLSALIVSLSLSALSSPALASGTEAYAMAAAGDARGPNCGSAIATPHVGNFFGVGAPIPLGGISGCGLTGGIVNTTNPLTPSSSHQDATALANGGIATLAADARADFGSLGVKANGSFTGPTTALTYHEAEAAAYFTDTLRPPGSGLGFIQLGFSIDGSMFIAGNSQAQAVLAYQLGTDPSFPAFYGDARFFAPNRAISPTNNQMPVSGFTVTPTSVSGAGTVFSYLTPVMLGSNFDLTVGLYASSFPGPFTGIANNDYFSTARLTSILLTDNLGRQIDFHIIGASGTLYDKFGAHPVVAAVPEMGSWAMMLIGFGVVGRVIRRRRQSHLFRHGARESRCPSVAAGLTGFVST